MGLCIMKGTEPHNSRKIKKEIIEKLMHVAQVRCGRINLNVRIFSKSWKSHC